MKISIRLIAALFSMVSVSAQAQQVRPVEMPTGLRPTASPEMAAKAEQSAPITATLKIPSEQSARSPAQLAKIADGLRVALRARGINVGSVKIVNESSGAEIATVSNAEMMAVSAPTQ